MQRFIRERKTSYLRNVIISVPVSYTHLRANIMPDITIIRKEADHR